jgi:multidrug efflux pump subunit AcrA (membrane-fusion protein)
MAHEAAVRHTTEEGAFPVAVAKVVRGNLEEMISMAGTVVPQARVEVFSRASGQVQQVKVKEGDTVHRNDLLAVMQGKDGEPVSILSPVAGVIARRSCEPGGVALAMDAANSEALFVVEDIEAVKVQVGLPETLIPVVKVGEEARVRVEAYPLDHYPLALFKGKITSVSPSLDVGSRTARAEVTIDNRDGRLKPGMSAMVGLVREKLKNVLLVPKESVIAGEEFNVVYVVKDNKVQETEVQIGASDGKLVQILNPERSQNPSISGEHTAFRPKGSVEEGDQVVTMGARMVYDGQKVEVVR